MTEARQDGVEGTTSGDELPEPYESRLTDAGKASKSMKREVALELDRRRDPLASATEIADELEEPGKRQVTRALKGLQSDGIVLKREGSTDLWYFKHPASEYAVPPDITVSEDEGFDMIQAITLQNRVVLYKMGLFLIFAAVIGIVVNGILSELGVPMIGDYTESASFLLATGFWLLIAAVAVEGLVQVLTPRLKRAEEVLSRD